MLYTVLNLESSAFLFHLLSNTPLQHLFLFHPPIFCTIFTHRPLSPPHLLLSLMATQTATYALSFPHSSQLSIHHLFITLFLHTSFRPSLCSSITFTHTATHILPLCPCPLFSVPHPSLLIPHFCSHAAPLCVLRCVLSTRLRCLFHC